LQRNVVAYHQYIANHASLSEDALHRIGFANAIDSIGSPLWYMTMKYVAARASLTHSFQLDVHTTPHSDLVLMPLDDAAYRRLSATLSRWVKANEGQMVWDPKSRTFRESGLGYFEADDLFKAIAKDGVNDLYTTYAEEVAKRRRKEAR
jgi:hypothetical protein